MSFLTQRFLPNALDVAGTGKFPLSHALGKTELLSDHRISSRKFVTDILPKGGVGAELGVFTGLFSTVLLKYTDAKKIYFVDPWWEVFGEYYPDWGVYTSNGRLKTRVAHEAARDRIERNRHKTDVAVVAQTSYAFLADAPDHHFDWIYLDSTHDYDGTRQELELLKTKLKPGGIIVGDDWHEDPSHPHWGVAKAVREAIDAGDYEMAGTYPALQWSIRSTQGPAAGRA